MVLHRIAFLASVQPIISGCVSVCTTTSNLYVITLNGLRTSQPGPAGALSIVTAAIVGGLPSHEGEEDQVWGVAQRQRLATETSEETVVVRPTRVDIRMPLSAKAQQKYAFSLSLLLAQQMAKSNC